MPTLDTFKTSLNKFKQFNVDFQLNLLKSHPEVLNMQLNNNFLPSLDNKTQGEFKLFRILNQIQQQLMPLLYPDMQPGVIYPMEKISAPQKLNPTQISQALDSIKKIAQTALQETIDNSTGFDVILDFLKSCTNFLISMATFGNEPNFFKTSTFYLEAFNQQRQEIDTIFEALSSQEKVTEFTQEVSVSITKF